MAVREVFVLGAGGHAKVVIATLREAGFTVSGLYDDKPEKFGQEIAGVPVLGELADLPSGGSGGFVIGIGSNLVRRQIAARFPAVDWITAVHPRAYLHGDSKLGPGTVVFAAAVIQPGAQLGAHCIVNTAATIDHDCELGDFVHVAPGCHLAGAVRLDDGVLFGIGCVAIPGVEVGAWTTVGAGAVVSRNLPPQSVCVGMPARVTRANK